MAINDAVDWALDLGGGTRVALIRAGSFRSDAGALFGPVPWGLWGDLVVDEVDDKRRLLQALNCLLIETRAGRVLIETGIGERVDEKTRAMRVYEGPAIVPALEAAGFAPDTVDVVAMSHLHFDHAGGLLRADGSRAFPRATIVAQRAEWEVALGDNPRLVASYVQPELTLVREGCRGLGGGRARGPAGRLGHPDRRSLDRPPGDRGSRRRSRCAAAGLLRRPDDAAVGRQPTLGHLV
jgi:glyoxylase-like metal-dependent hydrolase (beta-lactamase superfamily II)